MPYSGTLIVKVTSATGAFPVEGATVRVEGRSPGVNDLLYILLTDQDGNTSVLTLPAPDPDLSRHPNPAASPYSIFDITISNEGFYEKHVYSVSVFSGIKTILPVNLIPFSEFEAQDNAPQGTQTVISGENPAL
ncbi:MAG: hypothetical protein IJW83_04040 [Clostridia bacterium]|nr:hypothetical protein [Clostridia bacterium]